MENVSAYPPKKLNKSCENLKFPYKRRTLYNTCMYATWSFYMQIYSISSKKQFAIGLGTLVFLCSTCVGALILHVNSHIKWISQRIQMIRPLCMGARSVFRWFWWCLDRPKLQFTWFWGSLFRQKHIFTIAKQQFFISNLDKCPYMQYVYV